MRNGIRVLHRWDETTAQLVDREVALWNGRFPAQAHRYRALARQVALVSWTVGAVGMAFLVLFDLVGHPLPGWQVAFICGVAIALQFAALRIGLKGLRLVCDEYGIPRRTAGRMPNKHPEKFDAWLMKHYGLESHRDSHP